MATFTAQFEAIGTEWHIECDLPTHDIGPVWQEIHDRISLFDLHYSRFRDDSLVTQISRTAGEYAMPDDAEPMFRMYEDLYHLSGGAFTPLIGDTLVAAGYDASYSLRPSEMQTPLRLEDAITYKHPILTVTKPVVLDFGAAGKGYLIDIVAELLRKSGAVSYSIDAGGDIAVYGTKVTVGLEDPNDTTKAIGTIEIANQSICGSAGNRRAWDRFHHIINPHTLQSPRDIQAVWVIADTTMVADAIATALYFIPANQLQGKYEFEYLIVKPDYSIEKSQAFNAILFS